jgi:N-hydroxyarylamine O-acetyltransferase
MHVMQEYLKFLEIEADGENDLHFLDKLIKNHVYKTPWENIQLFFTGEVSLDAKQLITQYISNNRGGLCYQLNMTLYHLLKYLGFNVELRLATVVGYLDKSYKNVRNTHILNVITFKDQKYIADVGWGFIENLLSIDKNKTHSLFQLINHETDPYEFMVSYLQDSKTFPQYKIMRSQLTELQLRACTDYSVKNEEREVQNGLICFKKTGPNSSLLISNNHVKITIAGKSEEKNINEYGGITQALKTLLNISLVC